MKGRVLIIGGTGRVGNFVARDLLHHTDAQITITGRNLTTAIAKSTPKMRFLAVDLTETEKLRKAIADSTLVIHCAGPFLYRDTSILETCIQQRVNYLDISDDRTFVSKALSLQPAAQAAGVTAIVSTGVFPGISNSMVRQGVEQFDSAESIKLSYLVSGSGGAGVGVMRTTFLELQHPFDAWIDGEWQSIKPYSQREMIEFPPPYNRAGVYWFNTIESYTLPMSFPVQTVVTKFGSVPDFYNHLTWMVAQTPPSWLQKPETIDFLAETSYRMTQIGDRFTGIGIAIRLDIMGEKHGDPLCYCATMVHPNTAAAVGAGTGSIAEFLLSNQLHKPGVWPVEQALSTPLFREGMRSRGLKIQQIWELCDII